MNIREPAVAGRFYPSDPEELKELIAALEQQGQERSAPAPTPIGDNERVIGGVVPHAGYIFSGPHAIRFFRLLKTKNIVFDTAVIIHPIHAAWGQETVTDDHEEWRSPLGTVQLDQEFIHEMAIPASRASHTREHAAEVMLPFLQCYAPRTFRIVPAGMHEQTPEEALRLAEKIKAARDKLSRRVLIIASSDFSHYVHPETGFNKDQFVLDEILNSHPEGVYHAIKDHQVSACGYGPIMTLIYFSNMLCGIPHISILSRGHSGEVHPSSEVVDYISILFACHRDTSAREAKKRE